MLRLPRMHTAVHTTHISVGMRSPPLTLWCDFVQGDMESEVGEDENEEFICQKVLGWGRSSVGWYRFRVLWGDGTELWLCLGDCASQVQGSVFELGPDGLPAVRVFFASPLARG